MNNETKHTPGPWEARGYRNDNGGIWIDSYATKRGRCIAGTLAEAYKHGTGAGSTEANARLIAAAPELLDACRMLLKAHQALVPLLKHGSVSDYQIQNEAPIKAQAAIAKATGGAQ